MARRKTEQMKEVAFIVFSDIHLEDWKRFSVNNSRLYLNNKILKALALKAKEFKVPLVFVGDLLDNPKYITNRVLAYTLAFLNVLKKNKVQVIAIAGNHDQYEQNTLKHQSVNYINTFSQIYPNLLYINRRAIKHSQYNFIGIDYLTNNEGFEVAVKEARKKLVPELKNILLVHNELPGAVESNGFELPTTISPKLNKLFKGFDFVLCGHIHKPQHLRKNILITGATHQQRISDMGTKMGYWIFYSDLTHKFVPLNLPEFKYTKFPSKLSSDKNFYILKEAKLQPKEEEFSKQEFATQDRALLAKRYLKAKGVKSKSKKKLLINFLTNE